MKEKQTCAFVEGHDTFVSLPTGYGKYFWYVLFYHLCLTKSEVKILT